MSITFEVPNLDDQDPDELDQVSDVLHNLSNYAAARAQAHRLRKSGYVLGAQLHEAEAEGYYESLPDWAKF